MSIRENTITNTFISTITKITSYRLFRIASFSVLTAVAAQLTIPLQPVPVTLQTGMVMLAGAFLGARDGAYSQMLYLAMGLTGLPIFANGLAGPAVLFGPTAGYLLAFPAGAFIIGLITERYKNYFAIVGSMFLGNAVIIASGALYLDAFFIHEISRSLAIGGAVFSLGAVIKVLTASSVYLSANKISDKK